MKLSNRANTVKKELEIVSRKQMQFEHMQHEIRGQEQQFRLETQSFEEEMNEITERAHKIKENKEIIIHNIGVKVKNPKQNYIEGRLLYQELLPRRQN